MAEGKVFIMSPAFALATLIELAISGLLIYGFMYEDKVIDNIPVHRLVGLCSA